MYDFTINIKKNRFFALTTASIVGVIIANNAALATEINDGVQENVKYSLEMLKNEPLIIQELNGQESPVEVVFDGTEADLVREADGTLSVAESVAVEDSLAGVLANAEEVIVVWEMNPDLGEVTVTRDGQELSQGNATGEYVDPSVDPGRTYEYQITQISDEIISTNYSGAVDDLPMTENMVVMNIAVQIPVSSTAAFETASGTTPLPSKTVLRYLTFIREHRVQLPPAGCFNPGDYRSYFNGNGRDFNPSATASQSKTVLTTVVDWVGRDLTYYKAVSPTELTIFDGDNTVTMTETASSTKIFATELNATSSSLAHFAMHHEASNPFCVSGPIKYDLDVWVARSGNYTVTGSRVRVPDHEFYIRDDNKAWSTIWTRNISSEGFICLSATLNPECSYSDILVRGTR